MQEQASDMLIIQQVLQGNLHAYSVLVKKYEQYVFTLVLRYISKREEAEEVAQDVFVKAYKSLADFRGQSKFSTWLYTITNTTCISFLRKKKEQTIYVEEEKMAELSETVQKASDYSERKSTKKMLDAAINLLPETDARIVILFYRHEQTLDEIATVLGFTTNHVKVRLFRARQKIKEILERDYAQEIPHL